MRIVYWTELFWPYIGGIEVIGARFIQALREHGYEVIVVTSHGSLELPDTGEYKGIPIHRFPFLEALATRNLDRLMEARHRLATLKREFKPSLIHINFTDPTVFFHLSTVEAHPAPFLFTICQALPSQAVGNDTLLGKALRAADWVTANSAAVLAGARQLVPEITPYSSLIYYGVEVPVFPPAPPPSGTPRLLCLGRLAREKGFDLALTAFASLRDRFPHTRLVIAGDGPERPNLEQQAAELGLTDVTDFVGWVTPENVPALMNGATVVVMPSRWEEAFGLVALEAALMARPVVATRVGGLPEVVAHQQTGLLVEKEDSRALAEAITYLLDHSEIAAKMGQAARSRAQAIFGWKRHIDAFDALYRQLTRRRPHASPE